MRFDANPAGPSQYVKIAPNETVKFLCAGDPYHYWIQWEEKRSKVVPEGTPKASFRFRMNVICEEGGELVAKIWEGGPTVYMQLKALNEEIDLSATKLKVTREGSGLNTVYHIIPLLKETLSPRQMQLVQKIQLHDLKASVEPKPVDLLEELTKSQDSQPDDIPF